MKYMYTATFITEDSTVYARVPDLPGCITTGKSLQEAINMITDAASIWLVSAEDDNDPIPAASDQSVLDVPEGATVSIIQIDTLAYRAAIDTRAVRKNVSLPAWMANLADKKGLNCSQILQEGLMAKLG
ncbi:MAG: type II toxin-antitoxin system HicB family antitoxin [Lachnospiraceae bacterium]|nr:type II toxin-antitoxin system HicB family antitoxin [Lachnospiraceae bacterium]